MPSDWRSFLMGAFVALLMAGVFELSTERSFAFTDDASEQGISPSAYLITVGRILPDADLSPYTIAMIGAAEGRDMVPIAFDSSFKVFEGHFDHQGFISLEQAPSIEALKEFWDSPGYQAAIPLRKDVIEIDYAVAIQGH